MPAQMGCRSGPAVGPLRHPASPGVTSVRLLLDRIRTLLAVASACAGLAPPARAAIPDAVTGGAWCEVRTPHVRVLSDAGLARANHVAEHVERLHEQMARLAPTLTATSARTDVVFLFRSSTNFSDYLPRYQGRPEEDTGLYQPSPSGGFVLLADGSDRDLDETSLHESTHALLHGAITRVPLWLDEGLAEYMSTMRVDDADARVGEPRPEMLQWLRTHERLPMAVFLEMDATSPDYHTGERRQTFYAQSWLLVHLLLTQQVADLQRFDRYLAALHSGNTPAAAFTAAFGDPQALQYRLELYLQRSRIDAMNWSFMLPYSRMSVARRDRVANAEVVTALGSMLRWRADDGRSRALEHAQTALALDAHNAEALALQQALAAEDAAATASRSSEGARTDFEREQSAIAAYNNGAAAFNKGDMATANQQFRLAESLAHKPELVAQIAKARELSRTSGAYAHIDQLHLLVQSGRLGAARRLVDQLLAQDLDPTLRQSLRRLGAALAAR